MGEYKNKTKKEQKTRIMNRGSQLKRADNSV